MFEAERKKNNVLEVNGFMYYENDLEICKCWQRFSAITARLLLQFSNTMTWFEYVTFTLVFLGFLYSRHTLNKKLTNGVVATEALIHVDFSLAFVSSVIHLKLKTFSTTFSVHLFWHLFISLFCYIDSILNFLYVQLAFL